MDPARLELFFEQQLKLIERLTKTNVSVSAASAPSVNVVPSVDAAANSIAEFHYDPEANVTFDTWFRRYEGLFRIEFVSQDDAWKVRLLLRKLGPAELDKYCNIILPQNSHERSFDDTIASLKQLFGDQCSLFSTRYRCLQLVMNESDEFLTHVGIVNRECERFKLSSLTSDQFKSLIFICSLQSPTFRDIRTRLLNRLEQDPSLTLDAIAEEYKRLTNIRHDSTLVQSGIHGGSQVHAVSQAHKGPSNTGPSTRGPSGFQTSGSRLSNGPQKQPPTPCWHCGAWHFVRFCPFKQHRCRQCNTTGHKDGYCKSDQFSRHAGPQTQRHRFSNQPKPVGTSMSLLSTFQINAPGRRKYVTVLVNGYSLRLQLDTASDITILSEKLWRSLGKPPLQQSHQTAISACGGRLHLTGQLRCCVSFRDKTFDGTCYITKADLNLLGLDWFEQLGLDDLPISTVCNTVSSTDFSHDFTNHLVDKFSSVFQPGLGRCSTTQAELHLQPGSTPVFRPKRPVPYASLAQVDAELQRLEQQGVLTPVTYSPWAAPIVVVKKPNGSIRICADFSTGLNAALQQHHYPLPVPDDLFTILNGGTYFAKLDLADAYLQLEVSPDSRQLLTINTHRGMFQYTRLPFGVKTAPAIFQQVMDTILSGVPGVAAYLDDILIVAGSPDELRNRIETVLQRIQDNGFRLRSEKCQFFLQSVKYLGFIFDSSGRHPDPENIRAIQQMPAPKDVPSLRSFLGLISYYSAFLPSLHTVRPPLNQLLGKDVQWNWSPERESAFCKLKSMLSSDLLLTHYDPHLPIIVAADASAYGVGAVILHTFPDGSEKAIMHASRTLTPAERRYGQIEKEALALVFAVRRFHKLVYGRRFTLLTDHKPLLSIFGSKSGIPVHSANRLQRWALILLNYDFEIQYRRTADFGQADALSRLISNHGAPEEDAVIAALHTDDGATEYLTHAVRALPVTSTEIRRATIGDPMLQQVIQFVQSSWPSGSFSSDMQQFHFRRDSLCVVNDCLMFGERVVVPQSLRFQVLRQFHTGHPGISRMKSIARSFAYWPEMDKQITEFVNQCRSCQQASKNPRRVPPAPWPTPEKPWSRVHIDFAGPISGVSYLIVVDAYSKWPEIVPVVPPTTTCTLANLTKIFSHHGFPETLVSDNGSQFTSHQFQHYCSQNAITHLRSPPYHPQSNGQAERFVDTFKRALLKSRGEGTSVEILQRFLLVYRSTANDSLPNHQSPAEALMGRKLRVIHDALLPRSPITYLSTEVNGSFDIGQQVFARDYRTGNDRWIEGTIQNKRGNVMYDVLVGDRLWSRHENQLRRRHSTESSNVEASLPLEILLDTFQLPPNPAPPLITAPDTPQQSPNPNLTPRRWTDRVRRQTRLFNMDPSKRKY